MDLVQFKVIDALMHFVTKNVFHSHSFLSKMVVIDTSV